MRALGLLGRAEFRPPRRFHAVLLLAVVAVASAGLVAGMGSRTGAAARWDRAFRQANGAHVVASSTDPSSLAAVAADPEVAAATHAYRALSRVDVTGSGPRTEARVREMAAGDIATIARPLLRQGRWLHPGAAGEIVLDRSFALDRGLHVGDRVTLDHAGAKETFTVVGIAVDLVDCFFPQCDPTTVWVDPAGFRRLAAGGNGVYSSVFLRLRHPHAVDSFVTRVLDTHPDVSTDEWLGTRDDALVISGFFGAFLSGFGVLVMIAAAVVVASSMASRVLARRRQFGLLKAAGFTPTQVALSTVVPVAAVAGVAAIVGWVAGGVLAGPLQLRIAEVLGSGGPSFPLGGLVVTLVVVEIITVAATVVTACRTARLGTTAALAPALPRLVAARASRLVARFRLGPVADMAARDVATRPGRAAFTVTSLVLGMVAVVVTVGFSRTVDRALADPRLTGDPYEVSLAVDEPSPTVTATVTAALSTQSGVSGFYTSAERRVVAGHGAFLGRALGGDVAHAAYVMRKGRPFRAPGEAIAGYGLLRRLGIDVGDTISVRVGGRPVTLKIVGQYSEAEDGGEVLQFPLATLQHVEPAAQPEAFLVHGNRADVPAITRSLAHRLRGVAQVRPNQPDGDDEIQAFRMAFTLVTAVLLTVALANLGATLVLAVRERARALGVLRAVGFTTGQTVSVAAISGAGLGVLGAAVGLPLGWGAYHALMASVGDSSGIGPGLAVELSALLAVVVLPAIVVLAAALGALAARRTATIPVADLVRSE